VADKTPLRAVFNDSSIATGLAEFQSGDTIPVTHGGTGLSSLGSALQVLRVNSAGNALEFAAAAGTQNVFSTISVAGQSNVVADATTDTLTIAAGTGMTITTTAGTDTITFATSAITSVAADTSPQLGGNLDVNGNSIVSASNGNISITPNGSGKIILDGLSFPTSDGSADQVLKTDGSGNLSFATVSGGGGSGIASLAADSSPQLGGDLDVNGNDIVSVSNGNINLLPNGSGKVIVDGNGSTGGILLHDGNVDIRSGTGAVSKIKFYCEVNNAHAQTLQAQPHSAGSSAVITLPVATGTLIGSGDTGSVSNTMLAGSIAASKLAGSIGNSKLSNSSITIGSDAIALGASRTDINGLTSLDVDNITIDGNVISSTDTNGNITLTPNGSGKVVLDGLTYPASDGSDGQVITTDGSGVLSFSTVSSGGTAPTISSISPSVALPSTSTAITISGTGFVSVPVVNAINSSTGAIITPTAVTFTNATTIVATFNESTQASYYIRVENNDGLAVRSSSALLSISAAPSWSTSAGSLGNVGAGSTISGISVSGSSDSTVAYSETTSVLTSNSDTPGTTMNLTLNSSTGAITGTAPTPTATTTYNFTLRLTDAESQTADRAFSLTVETGLNNSGQFFP
tara:strand:- start:1869 stop:3758 length:1890 start_codon:yes stop_codon:yes gene_type:complete